MKIKRVDEMNESWETMVVRKAKYYARTSRPATCSENGAANGSYGDLALEVADKVEYLKKLRSSKNRL